MKFKLNFKDEHKVNFEVDPTVLLTIINVISSLFVSFS